MRLYELGAESIWFDEAYTALVSKREPWSLIKHVLSIEYEKNPPFYYVLLHFWRSIFGDTEFSLRLLSAVLGSISVIAIYWLGKLLFNKRAGIFAALILSVSVFHIQYSQEARAYSLIILLTIISYYSLVKLTSKKSILFGSIYLVTSVLMLYTHYYSIFILAAQNVFCFTLFIIKRKAGEISIKNWILIQLAIALAFIPGISHILITRASMQKSFWIEQPTLELLGQYLVQYSGSIYLLIIFTLFMVVSIISLWNIKFTAGFKTVFVTHKNEDPGFGISVGNKLYLLLLWMLFPVLLPFILSVISTPMFVARYGLTATLAFYLLASFGISSLKNRWAAVSIGLIILCLSLINLPVYYNYPQKHQWREVVAEIESSASRGDVIIVYPAHEKASLDYYNKRDDLSVLAGPKSFPSFRNLGDKSIWIIMHSHPQNRIYIRQGLSGKYNFELEKQYLYLDLFKLKQK